MTAKKTATRKKTSRKKASNKRKASPKSGTRKQAATSREPAPKEAEWESWDGEGKPGSSPDATRAKDGAESARGTKEAKPRGSAPSRAMGAPTTLQELSDAFVEHLKAQGKTKSTVWGYGMELRTAAKELGAETLLTAITTDAVARFYACDRVTKKRDGTQKAPPGVAKTRRVLRLALVWAAEQGLLESAPVPDLKLGKPSAAE